MSIQEMGYRLLTSGEETALGTRFEAFDRQSHRVVVLQVIPPALVRDSMAAHRIREAARAVAGVGEPRLPAVEAVRPAGDQLVLVAPRVEGQSLASFLTSGLPFSVERGLEVAASVCDLVGAAHRRGVVHGGLSAESVWLDAKGQVSVTDCGLWPALRPPQLPLGRPWGVPAAQSPEQARGGPAGLPSDVYGIGVLLYQMLAGRLPFEGTDADALAAQHASQPPRPLRQINPAVPPVVAQIVHQMLSKEPAGRYRTAHQVGLVLRQHGLVPSTAQAIQVPEDAPPVRTTESLPGWPVPSAVSTWDESYAEVALETEGVDWLMLVLGLVALALVIGLIPLWREVYLRWSGTPISWGVWQSVVDVGMRYLV
jgi:serine/threonine protein kinase